MLSLEGQDSDWWKGITTALKNNLRELSQDLKPRGIAEEQNESILCFLGSHSTSPNYTKLHLRMMVLSILVLNSILNAPTPNSLMMTLAFTGS